MDVSRFKFEGAAELEAALLDLGTEVATKIGVTAVRNSAKLLQVAWQEVAPFNPDGPTRKYWSLKGGGSGSGLYGHLRDNIKVRRLRARSDTSIPFLVSTGKAFWGNFLELGTVNLNARPWARPALDRLVPLLVDQMAVQLDHGIEVKARQAARATAKFGAVMANGRNG